MEQEMVWDNGMFMRIANRMEQYQPLSFDLTKETNLIRAAQRGDLSAFNQLVTTYQDDLFGWVMSLVHDEASAEDITQQTFVAAYQKIQSFRGESLRAWLFRIARNKWIDEIRYQRRRPVVSLDDDLQDEDSASFLSVLPADGPSPEDTLIEMEHTGWLFEMLNSLPEPFRLALQLVDVYEMDYQDAAEVLGLPIGTLKSRLSRARLRLRDLIEQNAELVM